MSGHLSAGPSENRNTGIQMTAELWCNVTDRGKLKHAKKIMSQCHLFYKVSERNQKEGQAKNLLNHGVGSRNGEAERARSLFPKAFRFSKEHLLPGSFLGFTCLSVC